MNETFNSDRAAEAPWPTPANPPPAFDASTPRGEETTAPPAVGLLQHAVQGAHDAVDGLADGAAPAVRQLGESAAAAAESLQSTAHQLRETRDEWVEGLRSTVRHRPLACVAAALAMGAFVARITR